VRGLVHPKRSNNIAIALERKGKKMEKIKMSCELILEG